MQCVRKEGEWEETVMYKQIREEKGRERVCEKERDDGRCAKAYNIFTWRRTSGVYILTYCHVADIFDCFAKRTTNCARETNAAHGGRGRRC